MKKTKKSPSRRLKVDPSLTRVRSAITNGSQLLLDVDHRSAWMRRLRDIIQGHVADAGGIDLLETLGLKRRAKDITPHPLEYARDYARRKTEEAELA